MTVIIIVMVIASLVALYALASKKVVVTTRAGCWMWFIILWTALMFIGLFIGLFS